MQHNSYQFCRFPEAIQIPGVCVSERRKPQPTDPQSLVKTMIYSQISEIWNANTAFFCRTVTMKCLYIYKSITKAIQFIAIKVHHYTI